MIDRQQPGQQGGEAHPNQEKQPPLIRILSFDGGGIRGVAVARILTAIEEELKSSTNNVPKSLREQATVMVGTSTGGLISLLMSMRTKEQNSTTYKDPMRAEEILDLYQKKAATIFVKSYNWIATSFIVLLFFVAVILGLIYLISGITFDYITDDHTAESTVWFYFLVIGLPILTLLIGYYVIKIYHTFLFNKFSQRGLKKIVEDKFGADRLDKAAGMVGICATDLATNKSILLNSYRAKACPHDLLHNAELHLVAKATAAAPTYFKYVRFYTPKPDKSEKEVGPWIWGQKAEDTGSLYHYEKELFKMEDGGTSNNNPASLGFKLARLYCKQKGYDVRTCRFQIISFGTGEAPRPGSTKKSQLTQQERQEELMEDTSLLKHVYRKFIKYSRKIIDAWKPKLQGQDDSSGDANEDALEDEKFQTKSTWKFLLKKTLEVIGAIIRLALWPLYTIYIFTFGLFLRWAFKSDAGLIEILHRLQTNPFEMESKSNYVDEKLRRKAMTSNGRIQYARVQFRIRPYQKDNMDDHSKGNIGRLIWRAERYIKGEGTPLPGTTPFKDVVKMLLTEEHTLQKDDLDYSGTQVTRPASH